MVKLTPVAEGGTKKCIACQNDMPVNAFFCCKCSHFQSKWKNDLKYIAQILCVITFLGGILVYIVTKIPNIRKVVHWQDKVAVLGYFSDGRLVLANEGDGDIYVTHISIASPDGGRTFSQLKRVDRLINKKGVLEISISSADAKKEFVSNIDNKTWDKLWQLTAKDDACFSRDFFYQDDPAFLLIKDFLDGLRTIPAKGTIHYYSIVTGNRKEQGFPVVGVIRMSNDPKCALGLRN